MRVEISSAANHTLSRSSVVRVDGRDCKWLMNHGNWQLWTDGNHVFSLAAKPGCKSAYFGDISYFVSTMGERCRICGEQVVMPGNDERFEPSVNAKLRMHEGCINKQRFFAA